MAKPPKIYTKQSFQEIIDFYFTYHHRISDYYSIAKYFFNPETPEEREITRGDPFFYLTANSCWALVILDLCKIFQESGSQYYNLITIFKNILTESTNKPILDEIGKDQIEKYILQIENLKPTIDKLKILRDKHYAHIDDINLDLNLLENPAFTEIEKALEVLENTVVAIASKLFDADYRFNEIDRINAKSIVNDVLKQRINF